MVWKWSDKSRFPGALAALLVNMRRLLARFISSRLSWPPLGLRGCIFHSERWKWRPSTNNLQLKTGILPDCDWKIKNRMSHSLPLLHASHKNLKQPRAELRAYLCHQLFMSAVDWLSQTLEKSYHSFSLVVIGFCSNGGNPCNARFYNK